MPSFFERIPRRYWIPVLIAVFSIFALWLRLLPLFSLGSADILNIVGSDDPLYNLRQVEQVLHNFPDYAWFDAMTHFPNGDFIYWGPLFTWILSFACIISGAATRPEIIGTTLLIPPIMATVLVPIMYYVGKSCGDWKTGLVAAGFSAVVSGQYFYRSFYGYLDHHIAEVFFATIFCLVYIHALQVSREHDVDCTKIGTLKQPALFAGLAGIAYLLGLFTMPTMILFAMIVAVFTLVQAVIDFRRGDSSLYLVLVNTVVFSLAAIGLIIVGPLLEIIRFTNQLSLSAYSWGHVIAYMILIGGTVALYGLARVLKGQNTMLYPAAIAALGGIASLVLFIFSPEFFNLLVSSFSAFFGQESMVLTVQEARGWDPAFAWTTFNYGLILMALGLVVLAYKNVKEEHPHQVFALIWSAIILAATWQHVRYEYYLAVNVVLLSAIAVGYAIDLSWHDVSRLFTGAIRHVPGEEGVPPEGKRGKKRRKEPVRKDSGKVPSGALNSGIFFLAAALAILFVVSSFGYSYTNAAESPIRMNQDWRESLEWLGKNTPATGIDYYAIDVGPVNDNESFTYPDSAYGVMSWWDYGHMITYIAKRIPNANPFQRGVGLEGDVGAAAFFMTTSEEAANAMADQLGTKYVITDIEMDSTKFPAMSVWFNSTVQEAPYQTLFAVMDPEDPGRSYQQILLNSQQYFLTMVSRLHNFDGSMTDAGQVYYIEYSDPGVSGISVPNITSAAVMNGTDAIARAEQYNLTARAGYHAVAMSPALYLPVDTVPALGHYRLIHESPTNVFEAETPDIRYVKIFEYVKGARIKGEGIIEVNVITNTGREFTYRQQSRNGEFVVPYSTGGAAHDVRTVGNYRIAGTTRQYDVPEEAVLRGLPVQ